MIDLAEEIVVSPVSFDTFIQSLLLGYELNGKPVEVSFRSLVTGLRMERATHLIHTYPAKLLMHIPFFFLNNEVFSKPGDIVLDPFSGSGTVMLEAILAGRNVIGADANPLARLISSVKVTTYDCDILANQAAVLYKQLLTCLPSQKPFVTNVDYWFSQQIQSQLTSILYCINTIQHTEIRNFFLVCFSNCVKKVSYADQRVSVPVKLNPNRYATTHPLYVESKRKLENLETVQVIERFKEIVSENIRRFKELNELGPKDYQAKIVSHDARDFIGLNRDAPLVANGSVGMIITSPPYAGAQKYIRSSSLNLGWLNMVADSNTLIKLDGKNIGRENYRKGEYSSLKKTGIVEADKLLAKIHIINPLRAHIASTYLLEMRVALIESARVLKHGGYLVLVVGNNQVCGLEFETQEYLRQILEETGLKTVLRLIDDIQSYGLMTKRNKTANIITREWVLVLKKQYVTS